LPAAAAAADRLQAGLWETTVDAGGTTRSSQACLTPPEAAAMNGTEKMFKDAIEKAMSGTGCSVTALTASGNQVTVTTQCGTNAITGTTTYHGDSYESENNNGTKVRAKRIGACP
jgi:Protein of unknown function (DUF3617)